MLNGQYGAEAKILSLTASTYPADGWSVGSDQVRITLPQFSGANELLSVVSGGDASRDWVLLRLEFDRYSPLESGSLTPVYNPRLSIACDGWTVEVKGRAYPVDRNSCTRDLEFGSVDKDQTILQFQVPGGPHKEFKVHSPNWRINWTLNSAGPDGFAEQMTMTVPDVIFERASKPGSLNFTIR